MNKPIFVAIFIINCIICLFSCNENPIDSHEIEELVDKFAKPYYTWHLRDAMPFTDDSGRKQLLFQASNISEEDINILKTETREPSFEIDNMTYNESDDTHEATVTLSLHNVIVADTLGRPVHFSEEAVQKLLLIKDGDTWKIHSIE